MHRRPWPIVFLSLLQLFTPIGTIFFSSIANRVTFIQQLKIVWAHAPMTDRIIIFIVPIILAWLIYFTKKIGLYLVAATVIYTLTKNLIEWRGFADGYSFLMLLLVSLCNLALVAYLLVPSVREIFFNPSIRWWEREPRYILNTEGAIDLNGQTQPCYLQDVSVSGASFQCLPGLIHQGDDVKLTFKHGKHEISFLAKIMYERNINVDSTKFGLRRIETSRLSGEYLLILSLISDLKKENCPITQADADTKKSFMSWAKRAAKSPQAWFPEKIDPSKFKSAGPKS